MTGGFGVESADLVTFSKHLDRLEEGLRKSADMVGSCVADPGIFGIFGGQAYGAGASMHCAKARDQLNKYAGNIQEFSDNVLKASQLYEAGDTAAGEAVTSAGAGIGDVKVP